jgi:hypothetical protein
VTGLEGDHPPCTFYCGGGEHADLAYWYDRYWTGVEIRRAWCRHGVIVTRICPAAEAAPRADGSIPHLVYWRWAA